MSVFKIQSLTPAYLQHRTIRWKAYHWKITLLKVKILRTFVYNYKYNLRGIGPLELDPTVLKCFRCWRVEFLNFQFLLMYVSSQAAPQYMKQILIRVLNIVYHFLRCYQ